MWVASRDEVFLSSFEWEAVDSSSQLVAGDTLLFLEVPDKKAAIIRVSQRNQVVTIGRKFNGLYSEFMSF